MLIDEDNHTQNNEVLDKKELRKEAYKIANFILSGLANDFLIEKIQDKVILSDVLLKEKISPNFYSFDMKNKMKVNFYKENENIIIIAIKNYNQMGGDLCGFHTMYNILNVTMMIFSNYELKDFYFEKLNCGMQFYKFHSNLVKKLLKQKGVVKEYLIEDLKTYGPLEREYINPTLKFEEFDFLKKQKSIGITKLFFANENLVVFDPENDIPKKQKVIDEFKNNKDKRQLVIILGVLNHWTSVIISKDPVLNDYLNINITNKQFYFYFLDSLNVEIFKCTNDEEISCYVKNLNEEKIEIGKKAMTEFEIKCFNTWFKDITLVLSLLDKLLTTSYSLEEYFIEKNIEGFVNYIVKEKLNWNTKEDCMNLYNLIKDKINPLVVRDETLGLADFFNFDGKKIRIFNSDLYNKCINCFDSCQNLKKNYLKFKSELLDEEDWYLNEFFDLINSLNKYLKRNN